MRTQRRAGWVVALLCAGAVALTLGATALSEARRPPAQPAPTDLFAPLHVPRIDVHQHLALGTVEAAVDVADLHGIGVVVNLSGGAAGAGLEEQLAAAALRPGRVVVVMELDRAGCCDDAWPAREAARLAQGKALGARGLAIAPELANPRADGAAPGRAPGERLALDSPRLQPLWDACAALQLPVWIQRADRAAAGDEREPPLLSPPGRTGDRDGPPTARRALDETLRVVERNPRVTFVLAPLGDEADDPAVVAGLLDRLPNLRIDLAARVSAFGRSAETARSAILAHPDRFLFGSAVRYVTDGAERGIVLGTGQPILLERLLGGRERRLHFDRAFRFLETRDGDLALSGEEDAGDVSGVGLPRRVLEQVYHRNAERLLGLPPREAR